MDSILEKAAVKRAQAAFDKHGISGKIKILSDSARTAAEAAAGLGIEVGQIASSLVFKLPDNRSLLVITSGRHRVDTQAVFPTTYQELLEASGAKAARVGI